MRDAELLMEFRYAIEGNRPYGKLSEEILRRMARARRRKKRSPKRNKTPRGRQATSK